MGGGGWAVAAKELPERGLSGGDCPMGAIGIGKHPGLTLMVSKVSG